MASVSPIGRVSFPSVFELNEYKGKKNYQVTLLFDKDTDLSAMKAAARAAIKEKWGDNPPKNIDNPFRDGNEKADERPEYKDKVSVRFKRGEKFGAPQVVSASKRPITQSDGSFYAGCWARVSYSVFCWEEGKNGGVSFGLNNIQKVRDDEPFSASQSNPDDDFDALEEVLDDDGDNPF